MVTNPMQFNKNVFRATLYFDFCKGDYTRDILKEVITHRNNKREQNTLLY